MFVPSRYDIHHSFVYSCFSGELSVVRPLWRHSGVSGSGGPMAGKRGTEPAERRQGSGTACPSFRTQPSSFRSSALSQRRQDAEVRAQAGPPSFPRRREPSPAARPLRLCARVSAVGRITSGPYVGRLRGSLRRFRMPRPVSHHEGHEVHRERGTGAEAPRRSVHDNASVIVCPVCVRYYAKRERRGRGQRDALRHGVAACPRKAVLAATAGGFRRGSVAFGAGFEAIPRASGGFRGCFGGVPGASEGLLGRNIT